MEISTANSTRRSRLGFFLRGVNALAEHTQNIIIVICLTTAHKEKALPLGSVDFFFSLQLC